MRGLAQSVARNSALGCDSAPARHVPVVERDPSNVGCAQNLPLTAPCRWAVADPLGAVGLQDPNVGNGDKGSVERRIATHPCAHIAIDQVEGHRPTHGDVLTQDAIHDAMKVTEAFATTNRTDDP